MTIPIEKEPIYDKYTQEEIAAALGIVKDFARVIEEYPDLVKKIPPQLRKKLSEIAESAALKIPPTLQGPDGTIHLPPTKTRLQNIAMDLNKK